jgi:hypothetical protein
MTRLMWLMGIGACALALAGGCRGDARVPVKGRVTFAGAPVPKGEIVFHPLGPGPVTGAKIVDGAYEAAGDSAVPAGRCKVDIRAFRPIKAKGDANIPFQQEEQYLPDKYNARTTLEYEVPATGPVEKNFELTP